MKLVFSMATNLTLFVYLISNVPIIGNAEASCGTRPPGVDLADRETASPQVQVQSLVDNFLSAESVFPFDSAKTNLRSMFETVPKVFCSYEADNNSNVILYGNEKSKLRSMLIYVYLKVSEIISFYIVDNIVYVLVTVPKAFCPYNAHIDEIVLFFDNAKNTVPVPEVISLIVFFSTMQKIRYQYLKLSLFT